MQRTILQIFAFVLFSFSLTQLVAVPAYRGLNTISLSDGSSIRVYLFGDESLSWYTSEDGYTLLPNAQFLFEYAVLDARGYLVQSGIRARDIEERDEDAIAFLATIKKGLLYSNEQKDAILSESIPTMRNVPVVNKKAFDKTKSGVQQKKYVTILVEFQDDTVPNNTFTYTREQFDSLFNQIGYTANGATGSVRDYFLATSYGKFDLVTTVLGPYKLSRNKSYYGNGSANRARAMITEAIDSAAKYIDFSEYPSNNKQDTIDGVYVIFAGLGEANGGGAETVWPHRGWLYSVTKNGMQIGDYACSAELNPQGMSGIGTICHESGHLFFGLPDVYDTDYATNGSTPTLSTLEIMDFGSYNNNERTPPLYTSISKALIGWVEPIVLEPNKEYTAFPAADSNHVFAIATPTDGEYFLIENKQRKGGWDDWMYGNNTLKEPGGLIVLHIDENGPGWNNNCPNCYSNHPSIRLVHADGSADGTVHPDGIFRYTSMHNDVFPGSKNVTVLADATGAPSTKSWAGANANVPLIDITLQPDGNITFNTSPPAAITENNILSDSIFRCKNDDFAVIEGSSPKGGNNRFTYRWLLSQNNIAYSPLENSPTEKDYVFQGETGSFWMKRIAYSADKVDTSEAKYLSISFSADTTVAGDISIANGLINIGESTGDLILTGNKGSILYWEAKNNSLAWEQIIGSEDSQIIQHFPKKTGVYYYRAKVQNGFCKEIYTDEVMLLVNSNISTPVTSVSLNKSSLTLSKGCTETLIVTVIPINATNKVVQWESRNEDIAMVNTSGRVVGIDEGETYIVATTEDGNYKDSCRIVVVKQATLVEGISLNKSSLTLDKGEVENLIATITPFNAENKTVHWESRNEDIAMVNTSGKVVGINDGETYIVVTTEAGHYKDSCRVTVAKQIVLAKSVSLNKSSLTLGKGGMETLIATVIPSNAVNATVRWESRNEDIAMVSANGRVAGVEEGNAYIIVTTEEGGYQDSCFVTISGTTGISNAKGETRMLTIYPNPTTGILYIETGENTLPEVTVYTAYGKRICTTNGSQTDLSDLPAGVYILQVGNQRVRIVKN